MKALLMTLLMVPTFAPATELMDVQKVKCQLVVVQAGTSLPLEEERVLAGTEGPGSRQLLGKYVNSKTGSWVRVTLNLVPQGPQTSRLGFSFDTGSGLSLIQSATLTPDRPFIVFIVDGKQGPSYGLNCSP